MLEERRFEIWSKKYFTLQRGTHLQLETSVDLSLQDNQFSIWGVGSWNLVEFHVWELITGQGKHFSLFLEHMKTSDWNAEMTRTQNLRQQYRLKITHSDTSRSTRTDKLINKTSFLLDRNCICLSSFNNHKGRRV